MLGDELDFIERAEDPGLEPHQVAPELETRRRCCFSLYLSGG